MSGSELFGQGGAAEDKAMKVRKVDRADE